MVRVAEVAPTDIRIKEMRCCLRLGMAIFPISALFLLLATWPVVHEGDEVARSSFFLENSETFESQDGFKFPRVRKRKALTFLLGRQFVFHVIT